MTKTTDLEAEIKNLYKLKSEMECPNFDEFKTQFLNAISSVIDIAYHVKTVSAYMGFTPKHYWDRYVGDEVKDYVKWTDVNRVLKEYEKWL